VVRVFYYAAQVQGRELVNSENVLVTTKDPRWRVVSRGQALVPTALPPGQMRTAQLAGSAGRFDVAWWYWAGDRSTISDAVAKLLLAWSRLRLQGDESAAIFIFTEPSARSDGGALLQQFAADMGGSIDAALIATRQARR
jgi:EpsI family protein